MKIYVAYTYGVSDQSEVLEIGMISVDKAKIEEFIKRNTKVRYSIAEIEDGEPYPNFGA